VNRLNTFSTHRCSSRRRSSRHSTRRLRADTVAALGGDVDGNDTCHSSPLMETPGRASDQSPNFNRISQTDSSVRCPAMGADHPLPPECHDNQQRLEDAEFCRAPWKH